MKNEMNHMMALLNYQSSIVLPLGLKMISNSLQNHYKTRLILFSNSEPPRLRDVVSHLITIETTINTHTHTHTHTRKHARTHTHTHTPTHTYKQFTNQRQYIRYFVHVGLSAATHRQFFLRQNIFRAFKNNDQIPDTFRILEKYTEKYT